MNVNETLERLQAQLGKAMQEANLQKAITTSTNITNYDLQRPAKNLYPIITPLRNRIPRVSGNGGTATNWKAILGITGSGVSSMPWIPEGQRSARMSYTAVDRSATYRTLGEEDSITEEALNAAVGFEDAFSRMTLRLLQATMQKEERAILGGNASMALGTVGTITSTAGGTGATLPTDTYLSRCVALTLEGWIAAGSVNGAAGTNTVKQAVSIVGADGDTYSLNGGSSMKSAQDSQAITLGEHLSLSVTAIPGAVAYAWYIGTTDLMLERITLKNSVKISTPLLGATQNVTAITADCSKNTNYAFDGLLYSALNSTTAYINTLATGTAGTGTPLTTGGRGNVAEIDTMLKAMWDGYRVSPSVLLVNSQEQKSITDLIMSTASAPLLRYNSDGKTPYGVVGNGVVEAYYNPYAMDGGQKIPVMLHPDVPPGTVLSWTENLPAQYQNNETPNCAEMHVRKEYVQTIWPQKTRKREVGVYVEETLAVYAPFAMGVINNIAPA